MKKLNEINYLDALQKIEEYNLIKIEKKEEKSKRIDLAKTFLSLGMNPQEISILIGVGASSLANVFGTLKLTMFNTKKEDYKITIEKIKEYNEQLISELNELFNTKNKNIEIKTNKNGLISKESIQILRDEIEESKKEKDEDSIKLMEDTIKQAAIIAVNNFFEEKTKILDNGFNVDSNLNNLKSPTNEEIDYTTGTLNEIAKTENGINLINEAMNSKAIQDKFKDNKLFIYSTYMTQLKLKPSIENKYEDENENDEEVKKKNKNKLTM